MDPPLCGGKRCGWWMWEAGLGSLESAFQRQSDFDLWDNRGTPARANARGFTLMPKTGKKEVLVQDVPKKALKQAPEFCQELFLGHLVKNIALAGAKFKICFKLRFESNRKVHEPITFLWFVVCNIFFQNLHLRFMELQYDTEKESGTQ